MSTVDIPPALNLEKCKLKTKEIWKEKLRKSEKCEKGRKLNCLWKRQLCLDCNIVLTRCPLSFCFVEIKKGKKEKKSLFDIYKISLSIISLQWQSYHCMLSDWKPSQSDVTVDGICGGRENMLCLFAMPLESLPNYLQRQGAVKFWENIWNISGIILKYFCQHLQPSEKWVDFCSNICLWENVMIYWGQLWYSYNLQLWYMYKDCLQTTEGFQLAFGAVWLPHLS